MPVVAARRRYLDARTLEQLAPLKLAAAHVVEGMRVGRHRSPLRGLSSTFAQHRPYVPGDELRHVDWRVYGRTRRYYVRQYEAETDLSGYVLLDASQSMHYRSGRWSKLEYGKRLAAALVHLIITQGDRAALAAFDRRIRSWMDPTSRPEMIDRFDAELSRLRAAGGTEVGGVFDELVQRIGRRSVVLVISDMFTNVQAMLDGLDRLRFAGHSVALLHVLDPGELELPQRGVRRWRAAEGAGRRVFRAPRVRAAYVQQVDRYLQQLRWTCGRRGVDYTLIRTDEPPGEALGRYLVRRSSRAGGHTARNWAVR